VDTIGSLLTKARKRKKISLDKAARETKIKKEFLEALEKENFEILPGNIYARAFLNTYAQYLEIKAEKLLDLYTQQRPIVEKRQIKEPIGLMFPKFTPKRQQKRWIGLLIFLLLATIVLVIFSQHKKVTFSSPKVKKPPVPKEESQRALNLKIKINKDCWLRVSEGEEIIFEENVSAGQVKEWGTDEEFVIRVDNAASIDLIVNDNYIGPVGEEGEFIHALVLTPEEVYFKE